MRSNMHTDFYNNIKMFMGIGDYISMHTNEYTDEQKQHAIRYANKRIIEYKREYRRKLKGEWYDNYLYPGEDGKGYGKIVGRGGDWDGGWKKIFFEGERWSEEEKQDFINENWVNAPYSAYDCTGALFTWAIDCFNVPSGVVCYIRESLDV